MRGMSRTLWPGRGSARGSAIFSSAPTAAVPSVNLGPPVGLPPDVLQHILTFVDGRGLAVCEQVCKGMRSTASDKQLYVTPSGPRAPTLRHPHAMARIGLVVTFTPWSLQARCVQPM